MAETWHCECAGSAEVSGMKQSWRETTAWQPVAESKSLKRAQKKLLVKAQHRCIILEMPVPQREHQGQQQLSHRTILTLEDKLYALWMTELEK